MVSSRRRDLIGGFVWIIAGIVIVIASARMDQVPHLGGTAITAPGLVPMVLGVVLTCLGATLAVRAGTSGADDPPWLPEVSGGLRRVLVALALILTYALGMVGHMPFLVATGIFITLFVIAFQPWSGGSIAWMRRIAVAASVGVGSAAAIYLVFERAFLVRLP
jgi:hypothetical protein